MLNKVIVPKERASDVHNRFIYSGSEGTYDFCLLDKTKEGLLICTSPTDCREIFNSILRSIILGKRKEDYYKKPLFKQIDLKKARLLFRICVSKGSTRETKRRLLNIKKLINIIEEKAGWKKTKINFVKIDFNSAYKNHREQHQIFLVTEGPREWLFSPVLTSLFILLIRSASYMALPKFENLVQFQQFLQELSNGNVELYPPSRESKYFVQQISDISCELALLKKNLQKFVENFNDLFLNNKIRKNYKRYPSGVSNIGIRSLLKGTHADPILQEKFNELVATP